MIERGIVLKNNGQQVELEMHSGISCEGCSACLVDKNRRHILQIRQELSLKPGELVELEILPEFAIKSAFLIFLFPIIMLILGYYIFRDLSLLSTIAESYRGIIGALTGLLGSYLLIFFYDRILRQKTSDNHIRIIRVIKNQE